MSTENPLGEDENAEDLASNGPPLELIADQNALSERALAMIVKRVPAQRVALRIEQMISAKTPQGNPDWRAIEMGVKLWLSYIIGDPIKRTQVFKVTRTEAPPMEQLAESPAGLEALARLLAKVPGGREAFQAAAGG